MACPTGQILNSCDFIQALVNEVPRFDELIIADIRMTDGWIGNVSTGTTPVGTPVEVTQDRFRGVWPNTARPFSRVTAQGVGCEGNPCDPEENCIGWGADRLTYYTEEQTWATPLMCYNSLMHITEAKRHIEQIITDILRPATLAISSMFLRKRALLWAKYNHMANSTLTNFTFQWNVNANGDEVWLDTSAAPGNLFLLVPQMLQNNYALSMLDGYAGKNPFRADTGPFIELVTDMDTLHILDKLGGAQAVTGGASPNQNANWRFTQWGDANKYWRYGFSGMIGDYLARVDHMGLRFNYVVDLGAGANGGNGNRYRYQLILPYTNQVTTGAGGAAGIGSTPNVDFQRAQYRISFQWHKRAMELLTPDAGQINPEMPFGIHKGFGGQWMWQMHDLGADANGTVISNAWQNKGRFAAWFKYLIRPLYTEFARVYFHKSEQFCIPQLTTCNTSPGYPAQTYDSCVDCPATEGTGFDIPSGGPIEEQ